MKKFFFGICSLLICNSANAATTKIYNLKCVLFINNSPKIQQCKIKDTRNSEKALIWRSISTKDYSLQSWIGKYGIYYMDSYKNNARQWNYRANRQGYVQVSPFLNVHNLSWN